VTVTDGHRGLKESEYRLIVETTSQGIWALDRKGRTTFINEAMAGMLGYSVDEIDGRLLWEFIPDAEQALAVSNFEDVVGGLRGQLELRVPRKDGSKVWLLVSVSPLVDENGRPAGALGMVTDIHDRKGAENDLRRAEERYRAIAENLPLIMYQAPLDGHRPSTYISPQCEALTGYTAEEWVSDPTLYERAIHPDDRERVLGAIEEANRDRGVFAAEYRILARDGRTVWVFDESLPVTSGGHEYVLGFVIDITEKKESERRLEAQHHVASILAERPPLHEGCLRILQAVCSNLDLDVGSIWRVDPQAGVLRHLELWHGPGVEIEAFEEKTRHLTFEKGEGIPGRVWEADEPLWLPMIEGDPNLPRAEVALRAGLRAAFAVPITVRAEVLGVIEFFSASIAEPNVELLRVMGVIGGQIGQFFERDAAKVELVKAEKRYRRLAEQLPLVTYIAPLDGHSPSIYMSPQIEALTGYTAAEWQADHEFFLKLLHPDDRDRVLAEIEEASPTRARFSSEYRLIARDGRVVWIEDESVTVHDEVGAPLYAQGYFLDITERKQAEERLREAARRYRSLIATANDAFISIDGESSIVEWNRKAEELFGWTRAEALGRRLTELVIPPEHREAHRRGLDHFLETGEGPVLEQTIELSALRRDGSQLPVEVTIWATENNGLYRFHAFIRDISERQALEEELRQAQRMEAVGRLAGGIAHDFNNLLLAIRGYVELAIAGLDESGVDGDIRESIEQVKVAADRATALTGQLLAFSRKQVLRPEVVDLNKLVKTVEGLVRGVVPESLELRISLDPTPCWVEVDRGQMEQAIMNLTLNARDAIEAAGGRVTIATERAEVWPGETRDGVEIDPGRYVSLSVSDTGSGMDDEVRSRIFEPFFTTKAQEGTGLGLATVYGFVRQSSGHVLVESGVGRGSTFTILLPHSSGLAASEAEPDAVQAAGGTETILLVEDEAEVRRLLARVLRGEGYEVVEAENGAEAVRIAETYDGTIHVMVTDRVMPEVSGSAAAERVLQLRPSVKVIHMSGYSEDDEEALGKVEVFLQKPFSPAVLAVTVRNVLDSA
jgi:two-component system cell cycle sensor histidine kinase/response regulator CckA